MRVLAVTLVCLLVVATSSTPVKRNKRSAFAFAGLPWPGFVGGGAFAGTGFGWPFVPTPMDYPRAAYFPSFPIPVIAFPKPWYEGENVCTQTKELEDPKELQEWFGESSSPYGDYSHESEQCHGSVNKYSCVSRYVVNGQSKLKLTKYECCHGFVRNPAGPGCIENGGKPGSTYYNYGGVSTSSSSGVEKVPSQ